MRVRLGGQGVADGDLRTDIATRIASLSEGQIACLRLVASHMSSREISARLGISPHTVDQRVRQSLQLLGVERRSEAAQLVATFSPTQDHAPAVDWATATETTKKGGSKLVRSETVTVRLDPKLNYLCELASRAQRRTKSSFIEWAIADSLGSVSLPEVTAYDGSSEVTLKEKASELWQVDEPDRLVALALIAPALLTHEEQLIWRVIRENGYIWRGAYGRNGQWAWSTSFETLIADRLRDNWEVFRGVGLGDIPKEKLPSWQKSKPAAFDNDLDDDVPF
jgi:DNA-binding CsgD family transcriptional regulator